MKRLLQSLISWWFATMAPIHVPTTTLTERENMRKRRLLSVVLGLSCLFALIYIGLGFSLTRLQFFIGILAVGVLLYALWLNRQGYLRTASLLYFFINGNTLMTAHYVSSIDPFMLLWACFFMTVFLSLLGLFISPWMLLLLAVIENLIVFWYLLVICHAQIVHLISPVALQSFLIFLGMLIYGSALVGVLYAVTTKKAIVQADCATEFCCLKLMPLKQS